MNLKTKTFGLSHPAVYPCRDLTPVNFNNVQGKLKFLYGQLPSQHVFHFLLGIIFLNEKPFTNHDKFLHL